MDQILFTEEHEWIRLETDGVARIGISDHAQEALGELVYIELPDVEARFEQGTEMAVIESVKAASELYAPVRCKVVETNDRIVEEPALVNQDPLGAGWFAVVEVADPEELEGLMDERAYDAYTAGLE